MSVAYEQYKIVVYIYIVGALCAFGIAGNVLSLVVLGRDRTIRRTTGFMLQMLAVADTAFLVSCLFTKTFKIAAGLTGWLPVAVRRSRPYITVCLRPIVSITWTASVWMVVMLTADRYIAICRPLHMAQYSTMPRLRRAVIVLWVLAVTYSLPVFFETEVVEVKMYHVKPLEGVVLNGSHVVSNNVTMVDTLLNLIQNSSPSESHRVLKVQLSAMFKNQVYQVVYRVCLNFVIWYLLPLAALVFFNQRLVHDLCKSHQLRRHIATDSGKGRQHTWMLVVVVIVFVVCQLPNMALHVCWVLYKQAGVFSTSALSYTSVASNLLLVVNSSVNVVIYCFMGRQFRAILLYMISCSSKNDNARRNLEVDPGRHTVPLQHVLTPHLPEQSQSGPERSMFRQSMSDNPVCQLVVVVDVHETPFEAELDTLRIRCMPTSERDCVKNLQDTLTQS